MDPSGKNRYVRSPDNNTAIDVKPFNAVASQKMPEETAQVLRGNPFLYKDNRNSEIYSIEDFLVVYKRKEILLGEVIRNNNYPLKTRKRIFKKAFKLWYKDYTKKKNQTFRENFRTIEVIKGIGNVKFPVLMELAIWIMFIAMIFIIGIDSQLWNNISSGNFGLFLQTALNSMYNSSPWLKTIGYATVYILMVLIVYSLFFHTVIKDYKRYYQKSRCYLDDSENQINRDFKKKRKKVYKYYKRNLKKNNPYFPPLSIKEVQEGEVNIATFNTISKATVNKSYRLMKFEPILKYIKKILLFLCIGGFLFVYGYSIISVIIAAI